MIPALLVVLAQLPNADRPASQLYQRISPIMSTRALNQPAVVNQRVFLGGNALHELWDVSNPAAPAKLSELSSPHDNGVAEAHQLSFALFADRTLHAATISGRGVDLWDITDPAQPVLEAALVLDGINYGDFTAAVWGVSWQGRWLYVGGTNTGLHIVDASNPKLPRVVKRVPVTAIGGISAGPLWAVGNLLVITTPKESSGVATLDISDPVNPVLLDVVDPGVDSYIGGFYGKHAFLLDPLRTYDVTSDPRNITLLGSSPTAKSEYVSFGDGHAFLGGVRLVAAGRSGIFKVSLADPANAREVGVISGRVPTSDDQFSVPIGNLVLVADDEGAHGAWLAVHATARDTAAPKVEYVNPPDGALHVPVTSRIGVSFSDQIELTSVTASSFVLRPAGGGAAVPGRWGINQTVVMFTPDAPLMPGVAYELVLAAGGVTDLVGNGLASEVRTTFTTSTSMPMRAPCAIDLQPVALGAAATLKVSTPNDTAYSYRFGFGDGSFGAGATASHTYAAVGRYPVTLTAAERSSSVESHYEAEGATLSGGVTAQSSEPGFNGTGYADFPLSGGRVTFANVSANVSGLHELAISFGNGDALGLPRKLELFVNGTRVRVVDFLAVANDWSFRRELVTVELVAGSSNRIELVASQGTSGPNIDRLSVPQLASTTCTATQIVHRPLSPTARARSSTIVVIGGDAFTVNTDASTVSKVGGWETRVGRSPRTLAVAPGGKLVVANQGDDTLSVLDAATGAVVRTVQLPYGSAPFGVVYSGDRGWVTLSGSGRVLALSADAEPGPSVAVASKARGLSVLGDRLFVSRFIGNEVHELDAASLSPVRTFALAEGAGPDTPDQARGVPNYLGALTVAPDGVTAWLPSKQDNTKRGMFRDGQALTHDGTVRPIVSTLDLAANTEGVRVDLNDTAMPMAVETSRLGDLVFVALQGTNRVEVRNAYNGRPVGSIEAGRAPEGLVLGGDGKLWIQNALSRDVTVVDVSAMLSGADDAVPAGMRVSTVAQEPLSAQVLRGKQLFHDAGDKRMSKESYVSCAACHLDGDEDGTVWDFTDRGEGLRNTITLLGRSGMGHGNVHFTGNFDELQDFENDIRGAFGGTGFLTDAQFEAHRDPLGPAKAGLSADLDALAAYVASLSEVPKSPYKRVDASAGKALFEKLDCRTCHAGPTYTDGKHHDVGTLKASSGKRRGETLTGIETQTLLGVFATAPYFHDGSAATLLEVLNVAGHGNASTLSQAEKEQLVQYLLQLDGREEPVVTPPVPPVMQEPVACGCSAGEGLLLVALLAVVRRRRAH